MKALLPIICLAISLCAVSAPSKLDKNLIVIVLMVKNEESVICQTLQPLVDQGIQSYVIFDTGSTDNTVNVVKKYFKKHNIGNAHIFQESFIDFSTSRNRALELAEKQFPHAHFMLMLDAEWYLEHGEHLVTFCKQYKNNPADAYLIRINSAGGQDFFIPRLMRPQAHLRFSGAIHEYLNIKIAPKLPYEIAFNYRPEKQGKEITKKRLQRDLDILLKEHAKNPHDSRTIYFLAQTYTYMGDYQAAYTYNRLCVRCSATDKEAAQHWCREQAYQACYESGVIAQALATTDNKFSWELALSHYLEAFALDAQRAEPLMRIAQHYWDAGSMELCLLFAQPAAEIPYPTHVAGIVESEVYAFKRHELLGACAGNLGKWDMSERALRKALQAHPEMEHLKKNLALVAENKQNVITA